MCTKSKKPKEAGSPSTPRRGEHTGKFAVFAATAGDSDNPEQYVAIAQLGYLCEGADYTYEYTPLLAFERADGSLLLDVSEVQPWNEPHGGLDTEANTLAVFASCPDAYVYANGLLAEGNRWRAAA
ncbi:MAG: hypothetical protein ACREOC_16695 [Gemmatimonadales bacterium]